MPRFTKLVALTVAVFAPGDARPFQKPIPAADPNTFTLLRKDNAGARRGGAVRFVPSEKAFLLWGFMDGDPEFPQELPSKHMPEHDVVAFDFAKMQWRDHVSMEWVKIQETRKPSYFVPRCYHGLTSGSERSLFRAPEHFPESEARPDLNISFDQAVYHPPTRSLVYFVGGLTVAYDVPARRWRNLAPATSPPPVLGGSLAYDPLHDEIILFGGGHVAEKRDDGRIVGYTDMWIYSFAEKNWRRHASKVQPPPRMLSRLVTDMKHQTLILFGGDGQSHCLGDTWIFDLKSRTWREEKIPGPPPRTGHFSAYDSQTGWMLMGGGAMVVQQTDRPFQFDHAVDLDDLWAFDPVKRAWRRLKGTVPAGAYVSADFDPERRLLLVVANQRAPGHNRTCDIHYSARSTYAYYLKAEAALETGADKEPARYDAVAKRPAGMSGRQVKANPDRVRKQEESLKKVAVNQWTLLADPVRVAPIRTWGSATFDSDRGRILLWGGGHCGYGGSDVDAYDVAQNTWIDSDEHPDYPHRLWTRGVRLAGVTFAGNPWTEHGRRIYAYDPTSRKMIAVRPVLLTTGYIPEWVKDFPGTPRARVDAKVNPPTATSKYITWSFDPDTGQWDLIGPAPAHVDTLVTTRHGVLGVNVDWPARLKDSGHLLPWTPQDPPVDNAVFRYDSAARKWERLGAPHLSPQNLYEMTSLAHDSKRDRLMLHGGGKNQDELWAFDPATKRWQNLKPRIADGSGDQPPPCNREMVYLPKQDVLLTYGPDTGKAAGPALWVYHCSDNFWQRVPIAPPAEVALSVARGQNRALVFDPTRELVYLVLGAGNNSGSLVYSLRYQRN